MSSLLSLAAVYGIYVASPGPSFVIVARMAIQGSRRLAVSTALGIASGSVVWATLAALGLGVALRASPSLQSASQFAGGACLLIMGTRILREAWHRRTAPRERGTPRPATNRRAAYRAGLLANLCSARTPLFFSSLFSSYVADDPSDPSRFHALAIIAGMSTSWYVATATAFSLRATRPLFLRVERHVDACCGVAVVYTGLALLAAGCGLQRPTG